MDILSSLISPVSAPIIGEAAAQFPADVQDNHGMEDEYLDEYEEGGEDEEDDRTPPPMPPPMRESRSSPYTGPPSILQIPSEAMASVLLRIFDIFCNEMHAYDRADTKQPRPFILSKICRFWYDLVANNAAIWRTLDFDFDGIRYPNACLRHVKKDTPLRMILAYPADGTYGNEPVDPKIYSHIVYPRSRQIETLHLHISNPEEFRGVETRFFVDAPPPPGVFKELRIDAKTPWYYDDWEEDDPEGYAEYKQDYFSPERLHALQKFAEIPAMEGVAHLFLTCFELPRLCPVYDNLISLQLFNFNPRLSLSEVISLCERSPNLETLKLGSALQEDLSDTQQDIILPRLRRCKLIMRSASFACLLFKHVVMPGLERLDVHIKATEVDESRTDEFAKIIESLPDCPMLRGIRRMHLHSGCVVDGFYEAKFLDPDDMTIPIYNPMRYDDDYPDRIMDDLHIELDLSSWGQQTAPFLHRFQKLTHVEVDGYRDEGQMEVMTGAISITNLRMRNFLGGYAVEYLSERPEFAKVQILELDVRYCRSLEDHKAFIDGLRLYHGLRRLRLFDGHNLSRYSIKEWMHYGIEKRVLIDWVESHEERFSRALHDEIHRAIPRVGKPTARRREEKKKDEDKEVHWWDHQKVLQKQERDYVPTSTFGKREASLSDLREGTAKLGRANTLGKRQMLCIEEDKPKLTPKTQGWQRCLSVTEPLMHLMGGFEIHSTIDLSQTDSTEMEIDY